MKNTTTTTPAKLKVPYHQTKWRTVNMQPQIKELLGDLAKAMGNGYTTIPLSTAMEMLIVEKHNQLFKH